MSRIYDQMKDIEAKHMNGIEYINGTPVYKFEVYRAPKCPTENGRYYASTPIFDQCRNIVKVMEENGEDILVKCITTGGKSIYLVF